MNPLEIQIIVADLMKTAVFWTSPKCHICLWSGELCCFNINHTKKRHPIFLEFSHSDVVLGYTDKEWNKIAVNINKHFKDKKCPKNPKSPSEKNHPNQLIPSTSRKKSY